jgi:propionyl-CoA carboxylase alpha chain
MQGQEVAVVEAMKMQNSLRAQRTGKVKMVYAKIGTGVAADDPILEFESEHPPTTSPGKAPNQNS